MTTMAQDLPVESDEETGSVKYPNYPRTQSDIYILYEIHRMGMGSSTTG